MGGKFCLCALWNPISDSDKKSESSSSRDDTSRTSFTKATNLKTEKKRKLSNILRRKIAAEEKTQMAEKLTLQDWILSSPGLKPEEYLIMSSEHSASKQSKKKVHPCLSGTSIAEAKDSLCLDRPMNRNDEEEEDEGMSNSLSSISISRKLLSGKSEKRVSFKLPHDVILYSPEEEEEEEHYSSEDSFCSSMGPNSFDSVAEEPVFRLAVDILPHVFVSSKN